MATLKKKKKLIKDFVKQIDNNIKITFKNSEGFCCFISNNLINVPLRDNEYNSYIFGKFIKEKFNINYNIYILSILHEIGHIKTYDKQLEFESKLAYLALQNSYSEDKIDEYNFKYFSMPFELKATTWAINFYNSNLELCEKLFKDLIKE